MSIFNFQVNYGKLLRFFKVAASDDPQQSKQVVDSNLKRTEGGSHHSKRYFLPLCGHIIPRLPELAGILKFNYSKSPSNADPLFSSLTLGFYL